MMMRVKELMTGLSEIPVVDQNATLFEAVLQMGVAGAGRATLGPCPAVLVVDEAKRVAGFLEPDKIIMALLYGTGESDAAAMQSGSGLQKSASREDPLEGLCKKAVETPIKSIMSIPGQDRITGGDVSISEAAYRMAASGQDYLFVLDGDVLEGIIRLSDVMGHICETVRACRL